jgi:regulator of sigma E protease
MFIVVAILILGILIFVHELGHFLVAKACGVGVKEFAIGFGPKVIQFRRNETNYAIRAIPLGGFVSMVGESHEADGELVDHKGSFIRKNYFQKFAVVFAGPLFNLIFAILVAASSFYLYGASKPKDEPIIGAVAPKSPAETAGLKEGDRVKAVNGIAVQTWESMAELINGSDRVDLLIDRNGEEIKLNISPELEKIEEAVIRGDSESSRRRIGIIASFDRVSVGIVESFKLAGLQVAGISTMTLRGISGMVKGLISPEHISGPIFIISEAAKSAKRGLENVMDFMVFLSVSLALLNLLPIPILDGGHLVVFTIEAIIRRPISLKVQQVATQLGFAFLMVLTFFALSNDIRRLFS